MLQIVVGKFCNAHDRTLSASGKIATVKRDNDGACAVGALPDVMAAIYADKRPRTDVKRRFHLLGRYMFHRATLTAPA